MTASTLYARAPLAARDEIADLRDVDELRFASGSDALWLRIDGRLDSTLRRRLLGVTGLQLLVTTAQPPRGLRRPEGRLAVATLPELDWRTLTEALPLQPRRASVPPGPPAHVSLHLERLPAAARTADADALLVRWHELVAWGLAPTTPAFRLTPLRFALRDDLGWALVIGRPLPPLPGRPLRVTDGVATPLGFGLRPALPTALIAAAFELAPQEVLLFEPNRPLPARLAATDLQPLSHSALRATRHAAEAPS